MTTDYDSKFYQDMLEGSKKSAEIVLPLVFAEIQPQSIVDVGCGTGAWLSVSKNLNISNVLGLDGGYAKEHLLIQPDEFQATDISKGFSLDRKFDLAFCLEVGEHIPSSKSSVLVDALTRAADVILFAAAIPGQGGTHHVNEQWPEFWQRLFCEKDFVRIDCLRPLIYKNQDVEWWYRQNLYLYLHKKVLNQYPRLRDLQNQAEDIVLIYQPLLEKHYGLVQAFLYYIQLPFQRVFNKIGLR